ncbi:MAG TPA: SPFH domain-containing protein [Candidatus Thermoplasmatota archaeon]|nr:SPFH domain-containing protein [Candidatus Thermoplasmatota archaeon]
MATPASLASNVKHSQEAPGFGASGGGALALILLLFVVAAATVFLGFAFPLLLPAGILLGILGFVLLRGFFVIEPNESEVIVLFGKYRGTVREQGWYWTNPLTNRRKLSLRVHNFNTPQLKVNDHDGNPIEIGAVVAWRVVDTARASFDVENYGAFVQVQSETAVRHIATSYPYDIPERAEGPTLRGSTDQVARELQAELQARLALAGIEVLDARITHLAYSPEIAGAMLQRQQASAILAARRIIVQGAVGMVEDVILSLEEKRVLREMSPSDRARMASALLVVLTSDRGAQPVVATTS